MFCCTRKYRSKISWPVTAGALTPYLPRAPADEHGEDDVLEQGEHDHDGDEFHAGTPGKLVWRGDSFTMPRYVNSRRVPRALGGRAMVGFLLRAAITALGLWVASEILSGLTFDSTAKLIVAAIMLGIVNAFVRPLAFILTLPITVVTLGLFLLVLNAGMVALVAWIVPGFQVVGLLDGRRRRADREPRVVGSLERHRLERPRRDLHDEALTDTGLSRPACRTSPMNVRCPQASRLQRHQRHAEQHHHHAGDLRGSERLAEHRPAEHGRDRGVHVGVGADAIGGHALQQPRIRRVGERRAEHGEVHHRGQPAGPPLPARQLAHARARSSTSHVPPSSIITALKATAPTASAAVAVEDRSRTRPARLLSRISDCQPNCAAEMAPRGQTISATPTKPSSSPSRPRAVSACPFGPSVPSAAIHSAELAASSAASFDGTY